MPSLLSRIIGAPLVGATLFPLSSRFCVAACCAVGGTCWALYAGALGYLGGDTFRHSLWKPMLVALAVGAALALVVELYRRVPT